MKLLQSLLCLVLFVSLILSSCSVPEAPMAVTPVSEPEKTLPPATVSVDTDIIKLWTKPRAEHHPLRGGDFQNRALDQLLYEPLFSFQNDGVLLPILAERAEFAADGLSVTIKLKNRSFSNGRKLTAFDAAESMSVWFRTRRLELGLDESPVSSAPVYVPAADETGTADDETGAAADETGAADDEISDSDDEIEYVDFSGFGAVPEDADASEDAGEDVPVEPEEGGTGSGAPERPSLASESDMLQAIEAIEVTGDASLRIRLYHKVDNLLTFLTCPVLTAEDAKSANVPDAAGTASYRIEYAGEGRYVLKSDDKAKLPIEVVIYQDAEAAMRAFQTGQLDVALLSPDEYAVYGGRQNVRFQSISVPSFLYLSFNTNAGYFAHPDHLAAAKALLSWQSKLLDHAVSPHRRLSLPVDLDDRRLPFDLFDSGYYDELPVTPIRDAKILLLRGTGRLEKELGENMRLLFERFGYQVTLVEDASEGFDLSLNRYDFSAYPDAYDFFSYAEGGRFSYLIDSDPQVQIDLLEGRVVQNRPEDNVPPAGIEYKTRYQAILNQLISELPLIGLAAPCGGVAYAMRVEGLLTPQYYCLYDGLENLVVWPHP